MRLLVVEDDLLLRNTMVRALKAEGFKVDDVENGKEGLLMSEQGIYDLILLDIMLPEMDGFSFIKELHDKSIMTPILLVTARDSVEDRVKGLDIGADDYLVKPFAMDELLARIRVLLRRQGKNMIQDELSYGPISLIKEKYDGFADGNKLNLTVKEYELLELLLTRPEQILTREQIFNRIWGFYSESNITIVDLYVHYLRKKLSEYDCDPYIRTIRGIGYMLGGA
ncbi:response regulator transcription factor [Paenibacillus sp. GP183]|uniref:response regulator transcription factor n=1 Tax=Paenibacillus sp. GP183 TaxID=1882751 RepID=UPI00089C0F44|nr:response regulator transcription factor [Paenibacillus sp. GP183]SEC05639.1 DNA-binding response regulator, OmpR family, contains REC and winged-helix (wHTH) domain [Paenibacillus sp. GP183]